MVLGSTHLIAFPWTSLFNSIKVTAAMQMVAMM